MTTTATHTHPLLEKHSDALDEARTALAARSWFSRYPESPSPRVYGETAAADGLAAYEAHLQHRYAALDSQPSDGTDVGSEVSPYGPRLGVTYPHLDLEAALSAARGAMSAWRDAGAQVRAAVCLEIVDAI
ncbi:MAG: phenylacetic acid degradation protein PaaN, partial [Actinomycetota bacterium]|nr:phenylacetic acid degradation protein PaaN [Actinomycetota bacterium]